MLMIMVESVDDTRIGKVEPILEKISVAPVDALIENLPSVLVVVPTLVPLTETLTLERGVPSLESVTLPVTS